MPRYQPHIKDYNITFADVMNINGHVSFYDSNNGVMCGFTGPMKIGNHIPPMIMILLAYPEIIGFDFDPLSEMRSEWA